jgi:mannose-6-phosphate isomerase-like protein (cupin superfamily)
MKEINRRDLGFALTAFAALGFDADAQSPSPKNAGPILDHSKIFPFNELVPHTGQNGMQSRAVLKGTLATGEYVEVHETMLPAGQMPHPPHRHTHSEFLLIREGTLQVNSDGQTGVVEAGGVVFTASGVLHSLKNIGSGPANYFVVAVGVQHVIA